MATISFKYSVIYAFKYSSSLLLNVLISCIFILDSRILLSICILILLVIASTIVFSFIELSSIVANKLSNVWDELVQYSYTLVSIVFFIYIAICLKLSILQFSRTRAYSSSISDENSLSNIF